MASTSKNISVEDAVSYLFELSDDLSDENGEKKNKNMNKNMRKRIRTRGGTKVSRGGHIEYVHKEDVLIIQ